MHTKRWLSFNPDYCFFIGLSIRSYAAPSIEKYDFEKNWLKVLFYENSAHAQFHLIGRNYINN